MTLPLTQLLAVALRDVRDNVRDDSAAMWGRVEEALEAFDSREGPETGRIGDAVAKAEPVATFNDLITTAELFGSQEAVDSYVADRDAVQALLDAAKPFDALFQPDDVGHMGASQPDRQGIYGVNGAAITLGDCRRLRAAIAQIEPDDEMPHPEEAADYVEFPGGEFPPQGNVGPLR